MLYFPTIDATKTTQPLQDHIDTQQELFTDDIKKATAILVAWGDGFMLDTIKKYHTYNIPFVGINFGAIWFLMNNITDYNYIPKTMEELNIITENLPKVTMIDIEGKTYSINAINDVIIWKNVVDYFNFHITTDDKKQTIRGTGIMITTPIWSTAYWLNNGWPIMPLHSDIRGVMGIASMPFHYEFIKPTTITIDIKGKNTADVGVDGYSGLHKNIVRVIIEKNETKVQLGFLKSQNFDNKRLLIANDKLANKCSE